MASVEDTVRFALPLGSRPVIHQAGLGVHGTRATETFFRPTLWALHLYFWQGYVTFGGHRFEIQPHNIGLTPPDTSLVWHFPLEPCRHYFVHFAFESEGDERELVDVPAMCALGSRFEHIRRHVEVLVSLVGPNRPRAEIALWNLLWDISDTVEPEVPELIVRPGAVETALGIIENELDQRLNAKSLAGRVGLSYSQLNRLFKEHFDLTLSTYITSERFKRADHLLRESNLPIKAVAERVGIPNLQHFNKFIRQRTGVSPRTFRTLCIPGSTFLPPHG